MFSTFPYTVQQGCLTAWTFEFPQGTCQLPGSVAPGQDVCCGWWAWLAASATLSYPGGEPSFVLGVAESHGAPWVSGDSPTLCLCTYDVCFYILRGRHINVWEILNILDENCHSGSARSSGTVCRDQPLTL